MPVQSRAGYAPEETHSERCRASGGRLTVKSPFFPVELFKTRRLAPFRHPGYILKEEMCRSSSSDEEGKNLSH